MATTRKALLVGGSDHVASVLSREDFTVTKLSVELARDALRELDPDILIIDRDVDLGALAAEGGERVAARRARRLHRAARAPPPARDRRTRSTGSGARCPATPGCGSTRPRSAGSAGVPCWRR